jgi:DNA-binding IclR family transcriptional regulator
MRALALLKAFTGTQPELGLTELARRAGLNKTTVFRLMSALESEGMVMRNPATDGYRLGPQMIALGGHAQRANDLHFASHEELETLVQTTGETATLEVLTGDEVLVLEEAAGSYVLGSSQSVGSRWPAILTSTGKVLLAHLPADHLLPPSVPTSLQATFPTIRDQGYAIAAGDLEEDFIAIGAPIRNHEGLVSAAISIGGPSTRLDSARIEELTALVTAAAARISKRLGYGY